MKKLILFSCFVSAETMPLSCSGPQIDWVLVDETEHFKFFVEKGAEDAVPLLA